jgi:lysophospholipase L1-like esterase
MNNVPSVARTGRRVAVPFVDADASQVVVCLGSSSTAGRGQAFGWIRVLEQRPQNARLRFHNLGVGGDLVHNALERVPAVAALRPDKVVILIGANDVLCGVFPTLRRLLRVLGKHPSQATSVDGFRDTLSAIVRRLKAETSAEVGLCSLGEVGEAPSSDDPVQQELNARFQQYNATIERIARTEGATYIPFYERLHAAIVAAPGQALTRFAMLPIYRDLCRAVILRTSSDQIARQNGWRFHVDGIHLNGHGGLILAEVVQQFLDRAVVTPPLRPQGDGG